MSGRKKGVVFIMSCVCLIDKRIARNHTGQAHSIRRHGTDGQRVRGVVSGQQTYEFILNVPSSPGLFHISSDNSFTAFGNGCRRIRLDLETDLTTSRTDGAVCGIEHAELSRSDPLYVGRRLYAQQAVRFTV